MKGSFINTDDIITYKEDGGIIYGYFNQEVMDNFLYNRAKENSHNFTDKDQIKEEFFKRALRLEDLSDLQHSIYELRNLLRLILSASLVSCSEV